MMTDREELYAMAGMVDWQRAEIQRLRAALMEIGAWKHPDQPPHPLQRMAREALKGDTE